MVRLLFLGCCLLMSSLLFAKTIPVKNIDELKAANKQAAPGDIIVLQNGEWKNVLLLLDCKGTSAQPITFKAQTAGKVLITGESSLQLGGDYIVVDGLYFTKGYAGKNAVIDFRISKNKLANHCRVTNTVIDDFNNPKRMDQNDWVSFSGKNNRVDHCSFRDKKNMGVLLSVILDLDECRENFHSIDHNYFGRRPALGSNGGEIMRVGVSQHCEFYSDTQITDNFFEECDGETEIISIKSCGNVVRNNLFLRCQGGVVLRHGNYNTVENNIFLGNDKEGTGGVRVINKGQWVVNNFFYKCRGVDFRSPLSVMNGIPNSPAHRYVQVTDAVIANNTWYNCASISFGEGSDAERTLAPDNVFLAYNIFSNDRDSLLYRAFDKTSGFSFRENEVSKQLPQPLPDGFEKTSFTSQKNDAFPFLVSTAVATTAIPDSLQQEAQKRLGHTLSSTPGFSNLALVKKIQHNAYAQCGASWYKRPAATVAAKPVALSCATTASLYAAIERNEPVAIRLTGSVYSLDKPLLVTKYVKISSAGPVQLTTTGMTDVFTLSANGHLILDKLTIDGQKVKAENFIASDEAGYSAHYNLAVTGCVFRELGSGGNKAFFMARKSMIADSVVIRSNRFENNKLDLVAMNSEKDDKGYYNAEKIYITHNTFTNQVGMLLDIYRGGNDESTLGPQLTFSHNKLNGCNTNTGSPLFRFMGVQVTNIFANRFDNSNASGLLIQYKDIVRARHLFSGNQLTKTGKLEKNSFVTEKENTIQ